MNEVDIRLKELKSQVESSMEQKQNDYNLQLEKEEEDNSMLKKAYDNVYKEIQQKKMINYMNKKQLKIFTN